ncbi:kinase-like protein [Rhizoctonia solani]|uniref:Kinase-like protein n=1 Tax=Rhizoctonia solani TaxID=456999 RepID=A0A8H7M909_9AGAM|nr:kinase-like protein [Rhizoctonia solani]
MSTIDSGVYLLESDVDASLAEPKHGKDKSARVISFSLKDIANNLDEHNALKRSMDSQLEVETKSSDSDQDEDVVIAVHPTRLSRASSVGNSYGITGIGRGFDWKWGNESDDDDEEEEEKKAPVIPEIRDESEHPTPPATQKNGLPTESQTNLVNTPQAAVLGLSLNGLLNGPSPPAGPRSAGLQRGFSYSGASTPAEFSPFHSPRVRSPNLSPSSSYANLPGALSSPQLAAARLNSPRVTRSRSNQSRRVSVVSGRQIPVARMPSPPPDPSPVPPPLAPRLSRLASTTSFISIASTAATAPPSPGSDGHNHYIGGRSIDNFMILGEAGRGAYGMVKRAREFKIDAQCHYQTNHQVSYLVRLLEEAPYPWHHPIEIYVMNALSNTSFKLPHKRPWDPSRFQTTSARHESKSIKDGVSQAAIPLGLPGFLIRGYLGQMADALAFLHSKGICHRDIKDENVVLGPGGRCWLIDFGSSGVVRRGGWDTFSGTLDYAGPEILRGARGTPGLLRTSGPLEWSRTYSSWRVSVCVSTRSAGRPRTRKSLEEPDGGGRLGDALELVKACLSIDVTKRPTFEKIMVSRYLMGEVGWAHWDPPAEAPPPAK